MKFKFFGKHCSQVKVVRLEQAVEDDEAGPEKTVKLAKGESFYCPYRAWLFSRKWIDDPANHIYCGKPCCWTKFNSDMHKNKELKVRLTNDLIILGKPKVNPTI